jgi:hypothetical protein
VEPMAIARARADTVRRSRGAVIALLAVLVVLIHHEVAVITSSPLRPAAHAGHTMLGMAPSSAAAMPQGFAADHPHPVDAPAHGVEGNCCTDPGTLHCATASVEVFKLAVPSPGHVEQTAGPYQAEPGARSTGTISRAPPDLSVLCLLRI